LNMKSIPKHVAIIMDGNRRWAKEHRLPVFIGHKRGEERIEPIIDYAIKLGIPYLTFWAFSTENWQRDREEVEFLMNLYRRNLHKKVDRFHSKNVRLNIIGNIAMFPKDIEVKTRGWMEKTKENTGITVNVALSYGGRDEIIRAINQLLGKSKIQNPKSKITVLDFENFLDTAGQPDPDLLIRTGGESRLSGFLLWQLEYAELYFTDLYWPDFTPEKFQLALDEFARRKRRFGK
jgi:undecaprenyl diphosphate synthase